MLVEPAMLLMVRSMAKYPDMTASLLDVLVNFSAT